MAQGCWKHPSIHIFSIYRGITVVAILISMLYIVSLANLDAHKSTSNDTFEPFMLYILYLCNNKRNINSSSRKLETCFGQ